MVTAIERERMTWLLLGGGIIAGVALRIFHLDHQTLTHPEFFVPAIPLPDHVQSPSARFTVNDVLAHALFFDKHPPGYYLVMLAWNRTLGIELFTMRMASVLFGVLALLAIPFWVRVGRGPQPAALAVWLLALHGFHLTWSQQLRPWVLIGTLGMITSVLIVAVARRHRMPTILAYAGLAALGLWSDYYFWPIFGAQVVWAVLHDARSTARPTALQAQFIAMILATPLLIYFWLHMTEGTSHIGSSNWRHMVEILQFGHVVQRRRVAEIIPALSPVYYWMTAGLGMLCFAAGLRPWTRDPHTDTSASGHPRSIMIIMSGAALLSTAVTWIAFQPLVGGRKVFAAAMVAPFAIVVAAWILQSVWPRSAAILSRIRPFRAFSTMLLDPVLAIPLIAFTGLMVLGQFAPILAPWALVCFTPFAVVISARGIARLGRFRGPVTVIVLAIFAFSTWQYGTMPISNREYQGLVRQMEPHLRAGDTILLQVAWYTAPMHYYLPPDRFRVLPPPENAAAAAALPDTLWVVTFSRQDDALISDHLNAILQHVEGYTEIERTTTPTSAAARFARSSASSR